MTIRTLASLLVLLAPAPIGPQAWGAEPATVESLLGQGYAVVSAVPSPAGPGLFLQRGTSLFVCFVAETPTSPALATKYCKPVR